MRWIPTLPHSAAETAAFMAARNREARERAAARDRAHAALVAEAARLERTARVRPPKAPPQAPPPAPAAQARRAPVEAKAAKIDVAALYAARRTSKALCGECGGHKALPLNGVVRDVIKPKPTVRSFAEMAVAAYAPSRGAGR